MITARVGDQPVPTAVIYADMLGRFGVIHSVDMYLVL